MKSRQLVILSLLAAGSVAATAAVLRTGAPTVAADHRGERVLPALMARANDITALTVREGPQPLTIERRDTGFVAADSGYPVKTDAVRDLVASIAEMTFEEARTSDPARYKDLGLADPGGKDAKSDAAKSDTANPDVAKSETADAPDPTKSGESGAGKEVVLRAAGGDLGDLVIGNRDSTVGGAAGGIFVRIKGAPQSFLVRGAARLPAARADWFMPVDLDVKRSEIEKIELSGGGRDTVAANSEKPSEFTLLNVPDERVEDTYKVSRFATLIESFAFQDVRNATKPADDARHMVVDTSDGVRLTMTSVGDITQGWVQIKVEPVGNAKDTAQGDVKDGKTAADGKDDKAAGNAKPTGDANAASAATASDAKAAGNDTKAAGDTKPAADAPPPGDAAAGAKDDKAKAADKAKVLAAKVDGYDFQLMSNQSEILGWTNIDVTNEKQDTNAQNR
jgi:hypothetical protein